jgi:hypothetical protein
MISILFSSLTVSKKLRWVKTVMSIPNFFIPVSKIREATSLPSSKLQQYSVIAVRHQHINQRVYGKATHQPPRTCSTQRTRPSGIRTFKKHFPAHCLPLHPLCEPHLADPRIRVLFLALSRYDVQGSRCREQGPSRDCYFPP